MGSRRRGSSRDRIAFRSALAALGLTQVSAAELFGIGELTVRQVDNGSERRQKNASVA